MTLLWFVVWLVANVLGDNEPLALDPVNFWTASLVLSIAVDLNRPRPELGGGSAQ